MATVVLNAWSIAYPNITNRIRASVYLQSSPDSLVQEQIDSTPGHPSRIWSFPGLPRNNYGFSLDEIDANDNPINNLAKFDVVPSQIDGFLSRDDEQIQVGTTVGFDTDATGFTFDGTNGKPNYIGWNIVPSEISGRGILVRGLDYSWDSTLGELTLLQAGDKLAKNTYWNIHFDPEITSAGNSYPTLRDFTIRLVTTDSLILASDFGNKLIIEPAGNYCEMSLPDINTIVEGRPLMVEVNSDNLCCVKFISMAGQTIKFLNGNLYVLPNESFWLYKFTRSAGVYEWRVSEAQGNFSKVGEIVSEDLASVKNKQLMDGTIGNINTHARIYNEVVLKLPLTQVRDFITWNIDPTFYSLADSNGNFHFPNRLSYFDKLTGGEIAGTKFNDQVGQFTDYLIIPKEFTSQGQTGVGNIVTGNESNEPSDSNRIVVTFNEGKETYPKHYAINKYVLL